jgi:hypothetical protein
MIKGTLGNEAFHAGLRAFYYMKKFGYQIDDVPGAVKDANGWQIKRNGEKAGAEGEDLPNFLRKQNCPPLLSSGCFFPDPDSPVARGVDKRELRTQLGTGCRQNGDGNDGYPRIQADAGIELQGVFVLRGRK